MRSFPAIFVLAAVLAPSGAIAAVGDCSSPAPLLSPDGRAATVFFDKFYVSSMIGSGGDNLTCSLSVPVTLPSGAIGIYKVDYRGFAYLNAGQSSELIILHSAGTDRSQVNGLFTDDTFFTNTIAGGLSGTVDSRITLILETPTGLPDAETRLDTVDLKEIGFTTLASVGNSLDALAVERLSLSTHLDGTADLLLGFNQPVDGPSNAAAIAAVGSTTLGATARWELNGGFSLLGGAAYVQQSAGGAGIDGSGLFAGGIRYVQQASRSLRLLAETGAWGSPDLSMHFTRPYLNGVGEGDTSGSLIGVYVRAGVLYAPNPTNQMVFSGTFARNWLRVEGYSEMASLTNLFPVTITGGISSTNVIKATLAWTSAITTQFDMTLSLAAGRTLDGARNVHGVVDWIGGVTGAAGDLNFVEYGARVGWRLTPRTTVDAFVVGTSGEKIGNHTQFGGALRVKF